ncbi:unnamed protein product [Urochloa humidicola]
MWQAGASSVASSSARGVMSCKSRAQENMAEHGSTEGGGRHPQSQGLTDVDGEQGSTEPSQENVNSGATKRAKWSHQAKLCLIELLRDHDVPGFRTQNAWSKEAWNNIVSRLNARLGTYTRTVIKLACLYIREALCA